MMYFNVEGLTKIFDNNKGIKNVSFTIEKGETLGFLGPNGAGKTTTIRCLMGFTKKILGQAYIKELSCMKDYDKLKKIIGYLPAEIAIPNGLNGKEFIEMMAKLKNFNDYDRINYLLKRFKLNPSQNVKKMSIGEKRKLAIIIAFMTDPEILILDEPTSGLDKDMQEEFIKFLQEEKEKGKTILLSSHIFEEVEALCDKIAIIKEGEIVSVLNAEDIKHGLKKRFEISFYQEEDFDLVIKRNKISIDDIDKDNLKIIINVKNDIDKEVKEISNYRIKEFKEITLSLEDYFMSFYKTNRSYGGVN